LVLTLALLASAHATSPTIEVDFVDTPVVHLVQWAAHAYDVPFVLGDLDALSDARVTVITHRPIPFAQGWDLFVSAVHEGGFAVVRTGGGFAKLVPLSEVATAPLEVRVGPPLGAVTAGGPARPGS